MFSLSSRTCTNKIDIRLGQRLTKQRDQVLAGGCFGRTTFVDFLQSLVSIINESPDWSVHFIGNAKT